MTWSGSFGREPFPEDPDLRRLHAHGHHNHVAHPDGRPPPRRLIRRTVGGTAYQGAPPRAIEGACQTPRMGELIEFPTGRRLWPIPAAETAADRLTDVAEEVGRVPVWRELPPRRRRSRP